MSGPRFTYDDPAKPVRRAVERPVYSEHQLTKGQIVEQRQALAAELSKAQAENAQLRHRLDVYARTARTAANLLAHLNDDRKPR